jgi:Tol biopolymer transport system component
MGEVYKARDTRLDRTVAVKVLPEHIAKREDLRAQFEREARAVASLNHPNICTLHDIGDHAGASYMVMELIDGETLAERIAKGAIPLEQALPLAAQIADALDRAHRAGVTHRDVKPQNIMLTRNGVKVLDFGLAKSAGARPGPSEETLTKVLTTEGTVMGTPQYMAPEQFEGKEADARADIWAFGAVLYEMVTGQRAFQGKSYASLVGAILAADPAPMAVKPFTPAWLERLVRRCLQKDPEDRYQSMRDIVLDLRSPAGETVPTRANRRPWAIAASMLVVGALAGWAVSRSRQAPAPEQVQRFQLLPPEGAHFNPESGFALSPDGRNLAFVATAPGKSGLWVRSLDGTAARLLPGTQGAFYPMWSPDGRSLAYGTSDKLWRIDVAGGSPVAVCDARGFSGGGWAPDGVIVFSTGGAVRRVPASGGADEVLTKPEAGRSETYWLPQVLPGGRILFYVAGGPEVAGIYVASPANTQERVRLLATNGPAVFAGGRLLWLRGSTLLAQRFDPQRHTLSGEQRPIADPVGWGALGGLSVAYSSNGLLAHGRAGGNQLTWVDQAGQAAGPALKPGSSTLGEPGVYRSFRVSPDGRRVAVGRESGNGRDLWMVEVERDAWSRFTFLPGYALLPVWSPDGRQVMFRAPGNPFNLYRKEASGAGAEQRVTMSANSQTPEDWSRDGRLLLYSEAVPGKFKDLWVLPVTPEGKAETGGARPYLQTRFNETDGRFYPEASPRWLVYTSDESGRDEVYVQGFPEPRGKFQISTGGGRYPEWSPDGRELYYMSSDDKLTAVSVKLGADSVTPSTPHELFAVAADVGGIQTTRYAVAPDGKRFLVLKPVGGSQPLEVIVNWPALLKKSVANE